jgi:hypothetical protein
MKKKFILLIFLIAEISAFSQKVVFLHHSTGEGVYYSGNVPQWISTYNTVNSTNYQVSERSYPNTPYDWVNYPFDYWNLWINNQCDNTNPNIECISKLAQEFDVIIFKHCWPGASILADNGSPSINSDIKTLANYQLQYRALRSLMDSYPNKKFIIWTLAPLHRLVTTTDEASRARQFVNWVKTSWLTEDAKSHSNIYIFDFFGYAAESSLTPVNGKVNCLKYNYEINHNDGNDSHPNTLANQTIGPLFAEFIVNTIKNQTTNIYPVKPDCLVKVYPNPASDEVSVDLSEVNYDYMLIDIFDLQGKLTYQESVKNQSMVKINTSGLRSGFYIVKTRNNILSLQNKLYIIK